MSLAFIRPVKTMRTKKHKIGPKVSVCIAGELNRHCLPAANDSMLAPNHSMLPANDSLVPANNIS